MEQSQFVHGGNAGSGNGNGNLHGDQHGAPGSQTPRYTLPGVMQYLQSQFTLVEKNRMLGDLEKSSLKLKIVELESERNTLRLQNERLTARVEELEQKLDFLGSRPGSNGAGAASAAGAGQNGTSGASGTTGVGVNGDTSLLRSLTRSGSRSKSRTSSSPFRSSPKPTEDEDALLDIKTIDVSKLLKARQFLKSATSEILYMLKSPTLELTDPLNLAKDDLNDFFVDPHSVVVSPTTANPPTRDLASLRLDDSDDNSYVDMSISLAPPFRTKQSNQAPQSSASSASSVELPSDTETVTDSREEDFPVDVEKGQKKKLASLLKRSSASGSSQTPGAASFSVHTIFTPNKCKITNQLLYCYIAERNLIKVWRNLEDEKKLKLTINLPPHVDQVSGLTTNTEFIVLSSEKQVLVYPSESDSPDISLPSITHESDSVVKGLDLFEHKILITSDSTIEIVQIEPQDNRLIRLFTTNYNTDGRVLASRFTRGSKYDIAILTTKSLILQNTTQNSPFAADNEPKEKEESTKIVPLSSFKEYLLTSKYLLVNMGQAQAQGQGQRLFLMDLQDPNLLKQVPIKNLSADFQMGYSMDDESLFFIAEKSSGSAESKHVQIFKVIDTGDILNIKTVAIKSKSDWTCVGNLGTKYAVVSGSSAGVLFFQF